MLSELSRSDARVGPLFSRARDRAQKQREAGPHGADELAGFRRKRASSDPSLLDPILSYGPGPSPRAPGSLGARLPAGWCVGEDQPGTKGGHRMTTTSSK